MNLSNLKPAKGSVKAGRRIGRGEGSGSAGTAGRGHKGDKARSGAKRKVGFEGGQMPLQRRVPKFGFKNPFRVEYHGINLDTLQKLADDFKLTAINPEVLIQHGLAKKSEKVKVLGRGTVSTGLQVSAHAFTASAKSAIEAANGSVTTL